MCGIFAYAGKNLAAPILIDGLEALEYRGYDSAGLYLSETGCLKAVGPVANLKQKLASHHSAGTSGIAHTRWATHGEPTEINAHPHTDCSGDIWLAHNGIIENHKMLRAQLAKLGHVFQSQTDSEVLAHLIEEYMKQKLDFESAVLASLKKIRGTFGLVIMLKSQPGKIFAARMGSPVALGIGEGQNFIASDSSPILRHTKSIIYLQDGEAAAITPTSHRIFTFDSVAVRRVPETITWEVEQAQKNGYEHFMMKEIMEGPDVVRNAILGRLLTKGEVVKLGGLEQVEEQLRKIKRIIIVGCGTAYYSGLVGEYLLEEYAGLPVEVEIASEFRYRNPIIDEQTAIIAISQSGETIDTLSAMREAKRKGCLTLGIVNAVGSTIARASDAGVYNHAGPEIGVASTKAFMSQLSVLTLFTLFLGRQRQLSLPTAEKLAKEFLTLPDKIEFILKQRNAIKELAEQYLPYENFLFMGRKYSYPIAYEGALKLKEVSYAHAEGYGAGEMKHGPIAMIDETFPTVAISPEDSVYEKMVSNIQEIKARRGRVLAITTEGNDKLLELADDIIYVPKTLEPFSPLLSVVPLQLFAYYVATAKGLNVDRPRNLAKSVTVE